jgi:flagellar biosynthesis/type III secretory pathway M-ring protein FliF/YscJ
MAYDTNDGQRQFSDQLAGFVEQSAERTAFVIRDWLSSGAGSSR